jgi:NADH-quinone oxidoreductase subunit H
MAFAMLIPVFLARSMSLNQIIEGQQVWNIITMPVAFLIYFLCTLAEVGRSPFDLLEAESEIVAGYHTEYSSLKFGMFFVGDFLHAFTISILGALLFLGGWRGPGVELYPTLGFVYVIIKTIFVYMLMMIVRGTLPRLRIDQMMDFAWKVMTPLMMVLLIGTIIIDSLTAQSSIWVQSAVYLAFNLALILITLAALNRRAIPKPEVFSTEQIHGL